ncbi:hypothetical protein [Allonocardiopsis opalescens]|uniref:Uncharacterized protein n=1 Tax=Allonocardiopsis opalescens TaxID=1144618 RepID=A0A2T0Q963_9ACTN|nr:hypothetical protein [Allonocardiopsis opalescens]PRY00426.1 hypothetical protein CLV72_10255 [Allonocardiopsis opalescens]
MMTPTAPAANPPPAVFALPVLPVLGVTPCERGDHSYYTRADGATVCINCGRHAGYTAAHPAFALSGRALFGSACDKCGAPVRPAGGGLICTNDHPN